jgi:hypothetical protein
MNYLREKTNVPVPKVYHYDSNPYNRLGGEIILMSKVQYPTFRVNHVTHLIYRHPESRFHKFITGSRTMIS